MPQSLASILVHLVFSTKHRQPFITPEIEPELYAYMATVFRAVDSPSLAINGTADHVHCLFQLSRKVPLCDVVEEIKKQPLQMDQDQRPAFRLIPMAGRLRRVFHRRIRRGGPPAVHRTPETAPPAEDVPGGVPVVFGQVRDRVRRAVLVGLTRRGKVISPLQG